MELNNVYMGKILVVDLDAGSCQEEELEEEAVEERLGGIGINLALYRRFQEREPIIIGTGLLTGTFAPASSAGAITAQSPRSGRVCHTPLMWQTAAELKYSGYDFVAILGSSAKPVRIWLHDEIAELADASAFWGKDVWETTDGLRLEHGDDYVQVLTIGPAGERGHEIAHVSENYWGSRDIAGLGALFGRKRLKALAMRGLGSLGVAEGFFDACAQLRERIRASHMGAPPRGLLRILEALGADKGAVERLSAHVHRSEASFNGIYPFNSFVAIDQDPRRLEEFESQEPGVLLTDVAAAASLLCLGDPMAVAAAARRALRLGLDPLACGGILARVGVTDRRQAEDHLDRIADKGATLAGEGVGHVYGVARWPLSDAPEVRLIETLGTLCHSVPPTPVFFGYETCGVSTDPVERARWWALLEAGALIMGICPLSVMLTPELSLASMAHLGALASGLEGLDAGRLEEEARRCLSESQELSTPVARMPDAWEAEGFTEALKAIING